MITQTMTLSLGGLALVMLGAAWWLSRWLLRRRIVRWLHGQGCEVLSIRRAQVGRVGWDSRLLCHLVEYTKADGRVRRKLCVTPARLMGDSGLFWREIGDDDLLPGDWQCFECRARIPKGGTVCPKCGWS